MAKKRAKKRTKTAPAKAPVAKAPKKKVRRRAKKKPPEKRVADCGVCGGEDEEIAWTDALDPETAYWTDAEVKASSRDLCVDCATWTMGRDRLVVLVLKEARRRMVKKARGARRDVPTSPADSRKFDAALVGLHRTLTTPTVTPDGKEDEELIRWGKRLNLESKWLEARA